MIFNIQLHTKYHPLLFPRERDQVVMEIVLDGVFSISEIKSLNRCRGILQCIVLSDLVMADGRYLESFLFNPGPIKWRSNYCFPPIIVSHESVPQNGIGMCGLTFGIIMQLLAGNSWSCLDNEHIQHTGNGYGTPPQLTTCTELRTELSTTIYHHSLNAARA